MFLQQMKTPDGEILISGGRDQTIKVWRQQRHDQYLLQAYCSIFIKKRV
jgi:hypothetical protein